MKPSHTNVLSGVGVQIHPVETEVQEGHAFDDEDGGPDGVAVADVDQRVERLVADSGVEFRELSGDELVQVLLVLRLVKVLVVVKDKVELRVLAKLGSMLQNVFFFATDVPGK